MKPHPAHLFSIWSNAVTRGSKRKEIDDDFNQSSIKPTEGILLFLQIEKKMPARRLGGFTGATAEEKPLSQ